MPITCAAVMKVNTNKENPQKTKLGFADGIHVFTAHKAKYPPTAEQNTSLKIISNQSLVS